MSRHIDADELRKRLEESKGNDKDEFTLGWNAGINHGIVEIMDMPTADVQEIKRGRWIETTKAVMSNGEFLYTELRTICSLCGKEPLYSYWHNEMQSPYCPWCGAKMDEVDNENAEP